ncbi:DUF4065 domain-containing protein [Massilia sp. CCM 8695]|uniref:DUF4065 domain-containing protein n=1 Tax=Massilia frigida TaxID=2609281 RepID=A0ABX0MZ04_9BURK|nr:Panacea domain-containing protein [Massilia frigida]NHZ78027.1 DUF4065 domain-containing protein [Massilia frigida]
MPVTVQRFDPLKAIEAIVYIASKSPAPGFHKISKIFYFADKLHLERYGCTLSGDTYIAMDNGPVPSRIYDFMKFAGGRSVPVANAIPAIMNALTVQGHSVIAKRHADGDYLSQSEVECLDEIIATHGGKSFDQLTEESHDPAWRSVPENCPIPLTEIIKTLPGAADLLDHYTK